MRPGTTEALVQEAEKAETIVRKLRMAAYDIAEGGDLSLTYLNDLVLTVQRLRATTDRITGLLNEVRDDVQRTVNEAWKKKP